MPLSTASRPRTPALQRPQSARFCLRSVKARKRCQSLLDSTFAIRQITFDCNDPSRLAEFWSSATGCEIVADYGDFVMVGSTPALRFQRVTDPTPGKNRVHIDDGGTEREALVERLRMLGATELGSHEAPGLV